MQTGFPGRRPRSLNETDASRISSAAIRGSAVFMASHAPLLRALIQNGRGLAAGGEEDEPPIAGRRESHAAAKAFLQSPPRRVAKIEPKVKVLEIESEQQLPEERLPALASRHRPRWNVGFDAARSQPLEVTRAFAVDHRLQQADGRGASQRDLAGADIGDEELFGNRLAEHLIDISQVPPEQIVKFEIVLGRMIVAVPPEPVAALRNQELLTRLFAAARQTLPELSARTSGGLRGADATREGRRRARSR